MRNDFVDQEMQRAGADGVDFVPLFCDMTKPHQIYLSFTKDQWATVAGYPKTNRVYWKKDGNGTKAYLTDANTIQDDNPAPSAVGRPVCLNGTPIGIITSLELNNDFIEVKIFTSCIGAEFNSSTGELAAIELMKARGSI